MSSTGVICLVLIAALSRCAGLQGEPHVRASTSQAAVAGQVRLEDGEVWIEGIDEYRMVDPLYEGVRIILAAHGNAYSPEYIQGVSAGAFRIGGTCPCAPTCANWISHGDFVRLLGYEAERLELKGKGEELAANTRRAATSGL